MSTLAEKLGERLKCGHPVKLLAGDDRVKCDQCGLVWDRRTQSPEAAVATLVLEALLASAPSAPPTSTCEGGVTVRWCPRCGTCTCPALTGAETDWPEDPFCPIHGTRSTHEEPSTPQPTDNRDLALAIIKRCAAYVRGYLPKPSEHVASSGWTRLQQCAEMMEAQPNAIINSAAMQLSASTCKVRAAGKTDPPPMTLDAFMALVTRWREDWLAQRLTGEEGFGDETTIEDWLGSVEAYSRVQSIVPNTSGAPPLAHGIIQCYCGVVVARCRCCKEPRQMQDGCAYCTPTPNERRAHTPQPSASQEEPTPPSDSDGMYALGLKDGQRGQVWCKVRRAGKTDPPQDCDWPFCGCDPHADKVVQHLLEAGCLRSVRDVRSPAETRADLAQEEPTQANSAGLMTPERRDYILAALRERPDDEEVLLLPLDDDEDPPSLRVSEIRKLLEALSSSAPVERPQRRQALNGRVPVLVRILRMVADRESPPTDCSDGELDAAMDDVPEITWAELAEMAELMRESADALDELSEIPTVQVEEINELPERIRRYVHDLETQCDPAGDVRTLRLALDENAMLRAKLTELVPAETQESGAKERN